MDNNKSSGAKLENKDSNTNSNSLKSSSIERDYSDPTVCNDLKKKHDTCFFRWYNEKFMTGSKEEMDCKQEYDEYRECLRV